MNKYLKRKDGIIIDAIKLMDEKGLHGLTTREIAFMQGITEPAIYRQFKNKNDLIRAILEDFAKYDKAIELTVKENIEDPYEALIYFGKLYSEYYENYPEIASIMFSIEYLKTDRDLYTNFKTILEDRKKTVITILERMKDKDPYDVEELAEIIMGVLLSQTMFWKMDGCSYSLSERIQNNIKFILSTGQEGKK